MDELKPCPACGSTDPVKFYYTTKCRDCGARIPNDRWNTRPIEDALRAENERLQEELGGLKDGEPCACRWDHGNEKARQMCELHEAWEAAIHDWAARAKIAEAENTALRARAEEAEKKLAWRPIETAPKDGRALLLHNNNAPGNPSGRMESCEGYNTVVGEWWASDQSDDDADGFGDWTCYMDAVEDPRCPFEPTHWMPLPAAPDQKGES